MEEKYNLVNEKLHKLADIDCDWDVDIKLQSGGSGNGYCSCIEWTDWSSVLDEEDASFKPCKFVRKKPVAFGKVELADFPPELQKELKEEDWSDNEDGDIPNIFDSRLEGKDWTDCLEKTFVRLELLKLGYEICWECKEYRNDHREFFENISRQWKSCSAPAMTKETKMTTSDRSGRSRRASPRGEEKLRRR